MDLTPLLERCDTLLDNCGWTAMIASFASGKVIIRQADSKDEGAAFSDLREMAAPLVIEVYRHPFNHWILGNGVDCFVQ